MHIVKQSFRVLGRLYCELSGFICVGEVVVCCCTRKAAVIGKGWTPGVTRTLIASLRKALKRAECSIKEAYSVCMVDEWEERSHLSI